uniref:ATP-binding cassette sub-family G member 2-like n=1 Tax=Monopterus albus TaxID=43700 RepID=UPI0009B3799F|nr:ATP-binding cassette sub-family G member 2-like [Monopterus albus]
MSKSQVMKELGLNRTSNLQSAGSGQKWHGSTVSFHNIYYKVTQGRSCLCRKKASKDILIDLNGIMKPGLNAIMGATGSGKSSFLDVLAARKDPAGLSGEVLIDGAPQPPNFKCLSGYVVQDDVVMGTLTVRENLSFSAALRLPSTVSQQEKEQKVNRVIQELGLTRVADSKVRRHKSYCISKEVVFWLVGVNCCVCRFGALFFIIVNQCFSCLSSAELFISERKLFIHEYISGYYRLSVYFLSKILSDIITLRTIPPLIFSVVAYFMIGLKPTAAAFFLFMFTVILTAYTATSLALAISADQTVVAIANIFITISYVFMMMFAGLLVTLPSIVSWLAWLKYLSIQRYGLSVCTVCKHTQTIKSAFNFSGSCLLCSCQSSSAAEL